MLKVLHVVSYFPPDRIGGVGEVAAHIHQALRRAGHQSTVLTTGVSTEDPSVIRVARSPEFFALASTPHVTLARAADVVHVHHGEGIGLLAAMRALRIRTPVLMTMHVSVPVMRRSLGPYRIGERRFCPDTPGRWVHRQVAMRFRAFLDRVAMPLADGMTFISRSAAIDVLGPSAASGARVIYNGLPPATPASGAQLPHVDLLFVGKNTERKRVELLPLILAEIRRYRPDVRLRIVGIDSGENAALVGLARELGVLDSIEFSGRLLSADLGPYYRAARALLVPSVYEGLPMVMLEAMQHGLPIVASRVSGHPEAVEDGICGGLLVAPDDPAAMAAAALRLIEDPDLAARLGSTGSAEVARRFSVVAQTSAYLAEYERLIGRQERA